MSEEQLVASISENMETLPITVADLKTPTAQFMQNYFITFLQEMGDDVESYQLTEKERERMTSPSSISHCLPLLRLFERVDYVAKRIFIKDFSLTDITQPRHKHVMYILYNFNTFYTYADILAEKFQTDMKEISEKKLQYKQLMNHIKSLQEEVLHKANMSSINDVLKQEVEEIKKKLITQQQDIREVCERFAMDEEEEKKLQLKEEKTNSEWQKVKHQLAKLQSMIVHSPEVNQMDLKLQNSEKRKIEIEEELRDTQNCVQEKARQMNRFKKDISDLEHGMQEMKTFMELATQKKKLDEDVQFTEKQKLAAASKVDDLTGKVTKVSVKKEQLSEQKRMMKTAVVPELTDLTGKTQDIEKKLSGRRQKDKSSAEMRKKINELEQQVLRKVETYNKISYMYDEMYDTMVKQGCTKLDRIGMLKDD